MQLFTGVSWSASRDTLATRLFMALLHCPPLAFVPAIDLAPAVVLHPCVAPLVRLAQRIGGIVLVPSPARCPRGAFNPAVVPSTKVTAITRKNKWCCDGLILMVIRPVSLSRIPDDPEEYPEGSRALARFERRNCRQHPRRWCASRASSNKRCSSRVVQNSV